MIFEEANKVIHPVETQWHYKMMIDVGFTPETKEQIGFVRRYKYTKGDHVINVSTGVNSDYWVDETTGDRGYWSTLKSHITEE
jgi:hypothetical protein